MLRELPHESHGRQTKLRFVITSGVLKTCLTISVCELRVPQASRAGQLPPAVRLRKHEVLRFVPPLKPCDTHLTLLDIVLGINKEDTTFCVALVCSREMESKILRTCVKACPVEAMHTLVSQLQKDTMPLLSMCAGVQSLSF
jgi:hypothetical protein